MFKFLKEMFNLEIKFDSNGEAHRMDKQHGRFIETEKEETNAQFLDRMDRFAM